MVNSDRPIASRSASTIPPSLGAPRPSVGSRIRDRRCRFDHRCSYPVRWRLTRRVSWYEAAAGPPRDVVAMLCSTRCQGISRDRCRTRRRPAANGYDRLASAQTRVAATSPRPVGLTCEREQKAEHLEPRWDNSWRRSGKPHVGGLTCKRSTRRAREGDVQIPDRGRIPDAPSARQVQCTLGFLSQWCTAARRLKGSPASRRK
jgi:hypothetical protein